MVSFPHAPLRHGFSNAVCAQMQIHKYCIGKISSFHGLQQWVFSLYSFFKSTVHICCIWTVSTLHELLKCVILRYALMQTLIHKWYIQRIVFFLSICFHVCYHESFVLPYFSIELNVVGKLRSAMQIPDTGTKESLIRKRILSNANFWALTTQPHSTMLRVVLHITLVNLICIPIGQQNLRLG